ncbi:MAG: segregation/condensation protein A, partial [Coriobacteriia bacterium]|nr:segregation/condensation protein A [Coriobacteriia bacterium]
MGYTVKTDIFEGPFDLLLHLVARQKVDIAELSISEIADQYLAYVDGMRELDLDVASDFLLVAATLLELKAASLLPQDTMPELDEFDDVPAEEARELLVTRLLAYKQFKNASAELAA